MKETLYTLDSKGKLRFWTVSVEDAVISVSHGSVGGKETKPKLTYCSGKNVGKANETSPQRQALIEAEAKIVKQLKSGYYRTQEEALNHVETTPMLAKNYNDHANKVKYPCIGQIKFNGLRMMVSDGQFLSKSGEDYLSFVPEHILGDINKITTQLGCNLDGEIYSEELSQQQINSAFRKPNDNTPKLRYIIYDLPSDEPMQERYNNLNMLEKFLEDADLAYVTVHKGFIFNNEEEYTNFFNQVVEQGGEGTVSRNLNSFYEYGKRSSGCIKRKNRQTTEAFVLDAKEDKNNQAVLTCKLESGIEFECLMLKNADPDVNLRLYENKDLVIGKYIEVEYEELSDKGVPTKPVGQRLREVKIVNGKWEVVE